MTLPSSFPLPPSEWTANNPYYHGIQHPGGVAFPAVASAPVANTPLIATQLDMTYPDETIAVTGSGLASSSFAVWSEGFTLETAALRSASDRAQFTFLKDLTTSTVSEPELTCDRTARRSVAVIWPKNANGWGYPVRINVPKIFTTWPVVKWAFDGDRNMQVFGKNLWIRSRKSKVLVQLGTNRPIECNILSSHECELHIEMPIGLGQGTCKLWVHNGTGGKYGWSEPLIFTNTEYPYVRGTIINVEDYSGTDQEKLEDAIADAITAGGGHVLLADKSVKTYTLTADLDIRAFISPASNLPVFLEGPENGQAHIVGNGTSKHISINSAGSEINNIKIDNCTIYVNHKDVRLANLEMLNDRILGCLQVYYHHGSAGSASPYQDNINLWVRNCKFRAANVGVETRHSAIKFENCEFRGRYHDGVYDEAGAILGGYTNLNNHGITNGGSHRLIIENCSFESENVASGLILTRSLGHTPSFGSHCILKNNSCRWIGAFATATNRNTNTGENFMFHGGEHTLKQTLATDATLTTVTLPISYADFLAFNFGTVNEAFRIQDKALYIQILTGSGKCQTRLVTGASGTTTTVLVVESFQNIAPVAGDIVAVTSLHKEMLIFKNFIDAVPEPSSVVIDFGRTGISFWRTQDGCVATENEIVHTGSGIVVASYPTGLWTQGQIYIRNNIIRDQLSGGDSGAPPLGLDVQPSCLNIMLYGEQVSPAMIYNFGLVFRDNSCENAVSGVHVGSFWYDLDIDPRNDAGYTSDANTGMLNCIIEHNEFNDMPLRTSDSADLKYAISVGANWLLMRNNTSNSAQTKAVFNAGKVHEPLLIVNNVVTT